jgi:hypothetical protein
LKKEFLTSIFVFIIIASFAQDSTKMTFAIVPFSETQDNKHIAEYGPKLIKAIIYYCDTMAERFTVVPTDKWGMAQDASESQYIDKAKSLGITYLITGAIHSVTTYQDNAKDQNGNIVSFYNSDVIFSMKIIESQTGKIFNSDTIHTRSRRDFNIILQPKSTIALSPQSAIIAAIHNGGFWVFREISKTFPDIITIVKVLAKDDKGGALLILVSGRSEPPHVQPPPPQRPKQYKIVEYATETVDGKLIKRTVPIGIAQVDNENYTECIVTDGRMDVAKKIMQGKKLFLER